jgi:hypothetical protein
MDQKAEKKDFIHPHEREGQEELRAQVRGRKKSPQEKGTPKEGTSKGHHPLHPKKTQVHQEPKEERKLEEQTHPQEEMETEVEVFPDLGLQVKRNQSQGVPALKAKEERPGQGKKKVIGEEGSQGQAQGKAPQNHSQAPSLLRVKAWTKKEPELTQTQREGGPEGQAEGHQKMGGESFRQMGEDQMTGRVQRGSLNQRGSQKIDRLGGKEKSCPQGQEDP